MALHGVPVPEAAAARVRAGEPEVSLAELPDAKGLEPGRPVRLIDPKSETLASGIADPENGVVRVWQAGGARGFDAAFFRARVEAALALRVALGLVDGDSAFRLVNGEGDGLAGLAADVYGPFAVIYAYARGLLPSARLLADAMLRSMGAAPAGLRGVVVKVRAKDAQAIREGREKEEIVGEAPPETLVVRESGVPYEVHLGGALNVGLFTDMREHRRGLVRFVAGRSVLNTFAYTGALSVAAARAGAAAVTSVDLSKGVLAWARDNFRLAGLDPDQPRFRFEVGDVMRFLDKEAERGASWDTIILDPPTVSAARASAWSMKKDYPDLVAAAARLLPPAGGFLWASANARGGSSLARHVAEGLRRADRSGRVLETGGLPPDYPTLPAWPAGRYLEIMQLWVSA